MDGQRHAPAALPTGKTRYPMYRRLSGPQCRSGQVRKISPPAGIRSPDRTTRSESLYRLRYPAPQKLLGHAYRMYGSTRTLPLCCVRKVSNFACYTECLGCCHTPQCSIAPLLTYIIFIYISIWKDICVIRHNCILSSFSSSLLGPLSPVMHIIKHDFSTISSVFRNFLFLLLCV